MQLLSLLGFAALVAQEIFVSYGVRAWQAAGEVAAALAQLLRKH